MKHVTTYFWPLAIAIFCAGLSPRFAEAAPAGELKAQPANAAANAAVEKLAKEVHGKGWIIYGARSSRGDWDLFTSRPDGSECRNLTRTPEYNEFAPQVSRDGRKLLYRRMPRTESISGNRYGEQGELIIANRDGSDPKVMGSLRGVIGAAPPGSGQGTAPQGEDSNWPWASWSPDGKQVACLSLKGISFVDVTSGRVVRSLPRQGFYQQLTWSPDGQWLIGVANNFGTGWSIARMNVATGKVMPVNRVDCCTPDWFPDSQNVIFSWRPPGQKGNHGLGWTQLWRASADGTSRQLVYGEDGRHCYGGAISPDGRYVLFTGNIREDGDPGHNGAPMSLMRLSDAPIIGGESKELRALHPDAKSGPALTLPAGYEPCWTASDPAPSASADPPTTTNAAVKELANEVHGDGWIVYSAKSPAGNWELYVMRPDGSDRRALTSNPKFNEAGPRVSPDGKRILYYRLPRKEPVNMTYGTFDLVIADADGSNPIVFGSQYPWASWGPNSDQIACLKPPGAKSPGIEIVDVASRKIVREIPQRDYTRQLVWSPDGKWFLGTANNLGEYWNIGRVSFKTGQINVVSETDIYNCTPDWAPDSRHVVYARGINPAINPNGHAEMYWASGDGKERKMLFAEGGRHIYGACVSPDDKYCVFTRSKEDFGESGDVGGFTMALMRRSDAPMIGDQSASLRKRFPDAKTGPWLHLGPGWEPFWTAADMSAPKKTEQQ